MQDSALLKRGAAEALGTGFLVAAVVGSGIMAERLSDGNIALALLANAVATGAILIVLIFILGPVSGAHLNPAVTLSFLVQKAQRPGDASVYIGMQILGGATGTLIAHLMFAEPLISTATTVRAGTGQWIGEFVATFGLLATILGCQRFRPEATPYAVGLFITAGYWFTSSTSFANPAVTLARCLTSTFTGIRVADAVPFILIQIIAAICATYTMTWFFRAEDVREASAAGHPRS